MGRTKAAWPLMAWLLLFLLGVFVGGALTVAGRESSPPWQGPVTVVTPSP